MYCCFCFVSGESDYDGSFSENEYDNLYDSDGLDEEVEKLKTSDPEFYKYLKECDKTLTKITDSNDDDYDEDDTEGIKSEKLHKPPKDLEVSNVY